MSLANLNILINDTHVGATALNVERTQKAAPTLTYNGGDDEYQPIIASQLSFNMLVNSAADAHFIHLLTGNETRYQVQLEEADTNALLWQGHLLPDQYIESYEGSPFFVQFTATDGLGRLKNKYLPDNFYNNGKIRVPKIITAVLKLTGNSLNTIIAPAFTNAAVTITENDKELDTSLFVDGDKKLNAYEILEMLMISLGSTVFQSKNYWYVLGINRKNETEVACEFYATDGTKYIADNIESFTREVISIVFEATPSIVAIPPFKTVKIDWDRKQRDGVFFDDVVYQRPIDLSQYGNFNSPWPVRYWQKVGNLYELELLFGETSWTEDVVPSVVGLVNSVDSAQIESNYAVLENGVYVDGGYGKLDSLDLKMTVYIYMYGAYNDDDIQDVLQKKVLYELTLDGLIIMSNKTVFDDSNKFDFSFSISAVHNIGSFGRRVTIKGDLEIKNIFLRSSGFLNMKIHPVITVTHADITNIELIRYVNLDVKYYNKFDDSTLIKSRNIDFTLDKEVSLKIGMDAQDITMNSLLLSPFVNNPGIDIDIPEQERSVNIDHFVRSSYIFNGATIYSTSLFISDADYIDLQANIDNIYIKNGVTGNFIKITDFWMYYNVSFESALIKISDDVLVISESDELYIKTPAVVKNITTQNYLRTSWRRVGTAENVPYLEAMAKMYHSTVRDTKFKIEGSVFGLVWPLDILQFKYVAPKNYNATSLTLKLDEGITNVVMIESVNKEITDYE